MPPTDLDASSSFRITGWHVLMAMVLFFGVIIAVDTLFIVKAYESFSGQIVKNPYEAGLAFNQRLLDQKHQSQMGWQVDAGLGAGDQLVIRVRDRNGDPVTGLKAAATLERPATERGRLQLAFREAEPGVYLARAGLAAGVWDMTTQLDGAEGAFQAERRIIAP